MSSKLTFASCVLHSDRAYYWVCSLMKDLRVGRRLPLELLLQCSLYQGQHRDDVNQSVRRNYNTRFEGDKI